MTDDSDDGEGTAPTSSHMSGRMTTRIEIFGRVSGRRRWTVEQKLAILRDALGSEGSFRATCERHEVGSGQLYTWRRQAMSGELTGIKVPALPVLAEVEVASSVASVEQVPLMPQGCGQIGIELPTGVKLTVDAGVDADALAGVLAVLAYIRDEGLKAGKLHVDDTPVPMLVPGPRADARRFNKQPDCVRRGKTAQARLWAYVVDDRPSGATTQALDRAHPLHG